MKTIRITIVFTLTAILLTGAEHNQNWTHFVRIGGNSLRIERVDQIVKESSESNVFGIETDNDITGRYESFLDPTEKLKAIRAVTDRAHAAHNYAFVYIAGLECITSNADQKTHTFMKDHPDWVQRRLSGEPAVFGGGSAFWIAKGDEDVWISPYATEWRKIYMERVRQIAATGIDGIYVDIPYWMTHFDGWEQSWASFDDYTVAAFRLQTGLDARKDIRPGDFKDAAFRRWVDFRIDTLTAFMREIDLTIKSANRDCMTIAEIYPGIEEDAVRVGADVYQIYRVVDVVAHEYNFASGGGTAAARTPVDWLGQLAGIQSFRSFAQGKASWMLTYSWDGEKNVDRREAMGNLFMAQLMSGANLWDARGHVMSGSNDLPTRTKTFGWIKEHEKRFYGSRTPISPIGVYFSPSTRNYFVADFMDSYKGMLALLMQSHLEVQVVTPANARDFGGPVLIVPDARCLSSDELEAFRSFAASGRSLIVTGETGSYDEHGEARSANPVEKLPGSKWPECPGRAYWRQLMQEFDERAGEGKAEGSRFDKLRGRIVTDLIEATKYRPAITVTASPFVAAQIAGVNGTPHVFLSNFKGLKSKENAVQIAEKGITVSFPAKPGSKIHLLPYLGAIEDLKTELKNGRATSVIPELRKGAVVWVE